MDTSIKFLFGFVVAVCFISCKKDGEKVQTISTTGVNFINASFNTINFYLNGTRINNTTSYYPGGTLGYVEVASGAQNYQVKIDGNANPLFSVPLTFSKDSVYSFYAAGTTANEFFSTTDVLIADTGGMAKLRFVNASTNAGLLSVRFEGLVNKVNADTVKFKDVPFKTTTDYILVPAGVRNLAIYQSSATQSIKRDTVTLNTGKIYTYYGYGDIKTQGLGSGLIINQ